MATEAFGRSERVVLPYTFEDAQVRDTVLLSEIECSYGGSKTTSVIMWLVNHDSSSDTSLRDSTDRHRYLLRVLRSNMTDDTGMSLLSGGLLDLRALGGSHPEGLSERDAIAVVAREQGCDLFERVKERLIRLVSPSDPLVIKLWSRAELEQRASIDIEPLSPTAASSALLKFLIEDFAPPHDREFVGRAIATLETIACLWQSQQSVADRQQQICETLKGVFLADESYRAVERQLREEIEQLSARIKRIEQGQSQAPLVWRLIQARV